MIKHTIYIAIMLFALASCTGEKLEVEGHIFNSEGKKASLEIMDGAKRILLDECEIVNDQFHLSASLKKVSVIGIYIDDDLLPITKLQGLSGKQKVVADHKQLRDGYELGRRMHELQRKYRVVGAEFNQNLESLKSELRVQKKLATNDADRKKAEAAFNKKYDVLMKDYNDYVVQAIKDNSDTEWALYKLAANAAVFDKKLVLELHELFRDDFKEHDAFKTVDRLMKIQVTKVGEPAIDFTVANAEGKDVSLSDYKGKVLVIDFWASWCKPCRAANPEMLKFYKKYKSKGVEIIGISLDNNKKSWLEAIEQDGLPWEQVSTLEGFECPVGFKYGVRAIPHLFVVDKEGILRGNKVHGPELEELVKELL